jgi:hypothetical protein
MMTSSGVFIVRWPHKMFRRERVESKAKRVRDVCITRGSPCNSQSGLEPQHVGSLVQHLPGRG